MRRAIVLAALALSGCTPQQQAMQACETQLGVDPAIGWAMFGLLGAAIIAADPGHQAYMRQVDACTRDKLAAEGLTR